LKRAKHLWKKMTAQATPSSHGQAGADRTAVVGATTMIFSHHVEN